MQLRDARLGDAQHLADLAQRELFVVVERDDEALALGQPLIACASASRISACSSSRVGSARADPRSCRSARGVAAGVEIRPQLVERHHRGARDLRQALLELVDRDAELARDLLVAGRALVAVLELAIARSISRARLRTERGTQSSERSSSIIAPRMREIAYVSNLISRSGSKRSIAPIRPSRPYEMRSPSSTCGGSHEPSLPATYLTSGA